MDITALREAASTWLALAEIPRDHGRELAYHGGTVAAGVILGGSPKLELVVLPLDGRVAKAFRRRAAESRYRLARAAGDLGAAIAAADDILRIAGPRPAHPR